jgi:NAD(P)-dependent dehydrogenase (short-subunit alcohol dehydrogenase family)
MQELFPVKGKVAVVTGGSRGIELHDCRWALAERLLETT